MITHRQVCSRSGRVSEVDQEFETPLAPKRMACDNPSRVPAKVDTAGRGSRDLGDRVKTDAHRAGRSEPI